MTPTALSVGLLVLGAGFTGFGWSRVRGPGDVSWLAAVILPGGLAVALVALIGVLVPEFAAGLADVLGGGPGT